MKSGFLHELRDGVTPRAGALVLAVLAVQLAFIASYIGAFHEPTPHRIPIAVAAPPQQVGALVRQLDALPGTPLDAVAVPDEASARRMIDRREVYGAFVVSSASTDAASADRLIIASGAGASVGQVLEQIITSVEDGQDRAFTVEDVKPALVGDARGLSGFYLALGWVVGGYLVAIALSTSKGSRPANPHRAVIRLLSLLAYALLSGLGGALVTGAVYGAIDGHLAQLTWFGALLVFASGAFTMALQAAFGFIGTGLTVLLFVVLGNPSAGGAYPAPLLPPFWRAVGPWLPPGLGTEAIRGIVYFHGVGVGRSALILCGYCLLGVLGTLAAVAAGQPRKVTLPPTAPTDGPSKPD
ncbi:DUF3533 domain-containing protein [Dactylosporangium aurantiacum]|uniref:DUF3533 domain-containing protein n=1 Tax=Dactylosporangium aurantiacum TaxID=35754 RepID=A0A9Q9IJI4_9ACTN|nr:DUF3533 domain-containing protein [Dactylosporangium aurantiacum]MDG6109600.1 DUF3533 domain-containing protein [Dactylosporangium aurantiacum]UWZ54223.1 DUF3533 domain-containing protein [Dactylosporangium aurantiacum]